MFETLWLKSFPPTLLFIHFFTLQVFSEVLPCRKGGLKNAEGMLQFFRVVREGSTKKMKLEQRLDGGEGARCVQWGKSLVGRGNRKHEGAKSCSREPSRACCTWAVHREAAWAGGCHARLGVSPAWLECWLCHLPASRFEECMKQSRK